MLAYLIHVLDLLSRCTNVNFSIWFLCLCVMYAVNSNVTYRKENYNEILFQKGQFLYILDTHITLSRIPLTSNFRLFLKNWSIPEASEYP